MKVTYRIPSKKVPYGYIEIEDDQSYAVMPDPEILANHYSAYIIAYQATEVAAFEGSKPKKVGVMAKPMPEDDINVAAQTIKDGLGATELSPEEAAKPWNKTGRGSMDGAEDETPTKSKPAASADWDF